MIALRGSLGHLPLLTRASPSSGGSVQVVSAVVVRAGLHPLVSRVLVDGVAVPALAGGLRREVAGRSLVPLGLENHGRSFWTNHQRSLHMTERPSARCADYRP